MVEAKGELVWARAKYGVPFLWYTSPESRCDKRMLGLFPLECRFIGQDTITYQFNMVAWRMYQ